MNERIKWVNDVNPSSSGLNDTSAHISGTTVDEKDLVTGGKRFGEEVTKVLEYIKGKLYVKKIIRPKYHYQEIKASLLEACLHS